MGVGGWGQTRGVPTVPSMLPRVLPGRQRLAGRAQAAMPLGRGSCRASQTCLHHLAPAWDTADVTQIGSKHHASDSRCLSDELQPPCTFLLFPV